MTDLAKLVVTLEAQTAQYQAQLEAAQQKLNRFSGSMNTLLDGLATRLAAAFAIDKIATFGASILENAATLERMSQSSGIAIEALSGLQFGFKQGGVDSDSFAVAVRKLNVQISDAANPVTKSAAAFKLLGSSAVDAAVAAGDTHAVILAVADAFSRLPDGANKTAIAVQLFGRAGEQMIPTLDKGSAGILEMEAAAARLGITLDDSTGKAAEDFEEQMRTVTAQLTGVGTSIMKDLLPTLSGLAAAFTSADGPAKDLSGDVSALGGALKALSAVVSGLGVGFKIWGQEMAGMFAMQEAAVTGRFKEIPAIWSAMLEDMSSTTQAGNDQLVAIWSAGTGAVATVQTNAWDALQKDMLDFFGAADRAAMLGGTAVLGSLDALMAQQAKFTAAVEGLNHDIESMQQKAAAIDVSTGLKRSNAAAAEFAVTMGTLKEKVADAGDEGAKLAARYVAAARALDFREAQSAVAQLTTSLKEQDATYGMTAAQTERYRTQVGELGAELRLLGPAGRAAADSFVALTVSIEKKDSEQAVVSLTEQVNRLTGKLGDAGAAAFELQNRMLRKQLGDTGDTAAVAQLDALGKLTIAQNQYNDAQERASRIESALADTETKINAARARGSLTDLQADAQVDAARTEALTKLQAIEQEMNAIAVASGNPALVTGVNKYNASLVALAATTHTVTQGIKDGFEQAADQSLASFLDGTATMGQALRAFLADFEKEIAQMVAKDMIKRLMSSALGDGSAGSGWLGTAAAMFGGARAGGGAVVGGVPYLVGEEGPEIMVPGMSGTVIPHSAVGGGLKLSQHFHFASGPQISRPTQLQVAVAASSGLARASRRA